MALTDRQRRVAAAAGIATCIAIPAEGLRQWAYRCSAGVLTVCYGDTEDVQPGRAYSLEECRARLDKDMLNAVETVERCAPGLPDSSLAAFADATFNLGPRVVCDTSSSTLARRLAEGDIRAACEELDRWVYAKVGGVSVKLPGLVKRRANEKALCLKGLE
jgi:lysozyme